MKRIALFRALQLGDMLCAVPAVRALRAAHPETDIVLLGLPWARRFARRFSRYFSGCIEFPGHPALPEQAFDKERFAQFLRTVHDARFDLLIQMHGNGAIVNPLVATFGARRIAGYCAGGAWCPDPDSFMPHPEHLPEVQRHLALMNFLGVPAQGEHLELPITPIERRRFDRLRAASGFATSEYVCVHPGARDTRRWWAPRKFARVADALAARGYRIVFTGTAGERDIVANVMRLMRRPAVSIAGKTSLGMLAAAIGGARLLLTNDTGASHVAAAMGTPSVIIFLASDPARWAPLDRELHRAVSPAAADIDDVLHQAEQALSGKTAPPLPESAWQAL